MHADPFCCSSYLALRWVSDPGAAWFPGVAPRRVPPARHDLVPVRTADGIRRALAAGLERLPGPARTGLLLSGGIDSAIVGALMPRGTHAFTIRFDAPGAVDEVPAAAAVAAACGFVHHVVDVTWADYLATMDALMRRKGAPLHPVEVPLFRAASAAARLGLEDVVVGNGADSTFGGMDKLLAVDWTFEQFVRRYTFLDPARALARPVPMEGAFEPYRRGDGIDVVGFLKTVHGTGIVEAFDNAITAAGCRIHAPFEDLALDGPLDIPRIRRGESKYLLFELFRALFPALPAPAKIPFARPLDAWMRDAALPRRPEFLPGLALDGFTGEQRFQLTSLARFLDLVEPA